MSPDKDFKLASQCNLASRGVFVLVIVCSLLLLANPVDGIEKLIQPVLIVLCILGVVLGRVVRSCQTDGNRKLRESQLRDAFDIPLGEKMRQGYYNNVQQPSLERLALTILENTRFTIAIIEETIIGSRIATFGYVLLFILLLAFRQTDLNWLLFLCQTIFSAEVVSAWASFERFLSRTKQARQRLRQHFIELNQNSKQSVSIPIVLSVFAEYECAKDEAASPLDSKVYIRINPKESVKWQEEMMELGISTQGASAP
ncbi:MAG: hypothetical protein WA885_17140 [Phormidesmis sp.]